VREFFNMTQKMKDTQDEFDEFLELLSPSLKEDVVMEMFMNCVCSNRIIMDLIERNPTIIPKVRVKRRSSFLGKLMDTINNQFLFSSLAKRSIGLIKQEPFILELVSKLAVCFATPEERIMVQNSPGNDMYFIQNGDMVVNITDKDGKEHIAFRLLNEGDYVGEISLLYDCNRTCDVIGRNYTTLARLNSSRFRMLCSDFPLFKQFLMKNTYNYKDPVNNFIKSMTRKIDWLKGSRESIYSKLVFKSEFEIYDPSEVIIKEGTLADAVVIIYSG
jgi:hypothetical protein